jgi:antitoxin ParD1/3/4
MNVSLTPELEALIDEKVKSGMYQSASEVVREALRLLRQRDQARQELRREVAIGMRQVEAGRMRTLTAKEFKAKASARRGTHSGKVSGH